MADEATWYQPVDTWKGRVEWIDEDSKVFVSNLYFPDENNAVDYVEEVAVSLDRLTEDERGKLRNFLQFTCTVELDEASIDSIKEVRDIAFLPPVIITQEAIDRAVDEFAFLKELPK